ncbi:glycosyltransferase [bacterium]|nr:glycosyltransferase [bacterium]
MPTPAHILMLAAENDALPGGKVGGVGDVVRDVPSALVALPEFDGRVSVVVPSAGFLHKDATASLGTFTFPFRGQEQTGELFEVPGKRPHPQIRQLVIHHPILEAVDPNTGRPRIYVDDPADRPFASDATRFACFSSAAASALKAALFGDVDRVHLHDWHAGLFLFVRDFVPGFADLKRYRTAFTIHNLALQGIRPLGESGSEAGSSESSLAAWFPGVDYDASIVADPDYTGCVNPMAIGIRLADAVHVVSPGYADEVCRPSRPHRNSPDCVFFGGEGLEADLQRARDEGRLHGILNGCEYAEQMQLPERTEATWRELLTTLEAEVAVWFERKQSPRHNLALRRLRELLNSGRPRPTVVMTSVTRVVDQKVRLMREPADVAPLDRILEQTAHDAIYLLAGTGDVGYETWLDEVARRHPNLIFLNGYSQSGADALYKAGDLFLMPSAFEPCGISQMLAMRDGQPCVVHSIGGLKNTVHDRETGFSFSGDTPEALAHGFITCTRRAVALKRDNPAEFARIQQEAFETRFLWSDSVREYLARLY